MSGKIREMKENDWPAVSAIYTQGLIKGKSTFETTCPDYETWSNNHLKDCRYVIEVDDKVIGWCAIGATSKRAAYKGVVEESIYLDEAYHNKGYGQKLLKYLCAQCEAKGYWCICSAIFSNNLASIALHKKCGFRVVGYRERIAKDRFGEWQDTIIIEKRF